MSASSTDSPLDRVPIVQSVVGGVAAWVVGLIVTLILVAATEDGDDLFNSAGNLLYNAHFVDTQSEVSMMGQTQTDSYNALSEGATELPEFVYYVIPIIALLVAGIAIVRMAGITDEQDAAIAGAASAIGYLVLTIVGTFLFTWEQSQQGVTAEISPELGVMTIVLMGIVYPAVLGGIGGFVGTRL